MARNVRWTRRPRRLGLALLVTAALLPRAAWGCACGCSIFDVGTSSMFPESSGGMAFVEVDYQDQNRNWSGDSKAPADNNDDKKIRTYFVTAGLQYMFDRSWGVQVEVPYANRTFAGADVGTVTWGNLGDIRVKGIYTGFSEDMSTGVTFGLKLPTGDDAHSGADSDTQIGTGSADLLLGGFHRDGLAGSHDWNWFVQGQLDLPMVTRGGYRPGLEADAAAGIYYRGLKIGQLAITPVAQILFSERTSDSGPSAASPVASGYQRVLLSPGIEFRLHRVSVYGDVEVPVFQNMRGNQLVAPVLLKLVIAFHF